MGCKYLSKGICNSPKCAGKNIQARKVESISQCNQNYRQCSLYNVATVKKEKTYKKNSTKKISNGIDIKCPHCGNIYKIKQPSNGKSIQHICYRCKKELESYMNKFSGRMETWIPEKNGIHIKCIECGSIYIIKEPKNGIHINHSCYMCKTRMTTEKTWILRDIKTYRK